MNKIVRMVLLILLMNIMIGVLYTVTVFADGETPVPTAEPTPETEPVPTAEPTPETEPVPTAEPTPETEPVPTAEPTPETEPVPTAEPTPETEPVPTAEPTPETELVSRAVPSFGVISISDQVFVVNEPIHGVILPQAYPLDHLFYYDLSTPQGIEFNPDTREITGTPTQTGSWDGIVYRVYNNESNQDIIIFELSIVEPNDVQADDSNIANTINPTITPTTKERLTSSAKEAVDETADVIDNALQGKVSPVSIGGDDNSLTNVVIGIIIGVVFVVIVLHMLTNMLKGTN